MLKKISFNKIFDVVAFGVLLLQLTELFRFSLFGGVSLASVAAMTVFFLSIHIVFNLETLRRIRNLLVLGALFSLSVLIPLILTPYHLFSDYISSGELVRVFANSIMYFEISVSAMILANKCSYSVLRYWFMMVLGVVVIGFGINYINPSLFYALKLATWGVEKSIEGIEYAEVERVGGFYLKSTYASVSLVMLTPVGIFLMSKKSFFTALLAYLGFVILIFLTGARSGLAITFVSSLFFILPLFQFIRKRFKTGVQNGLRLGLTFLPISLALVSVFFAVVLMMVPSPKRDALLGRAASLLSTEKLLKDESLNQRGTAQLLYLNKIGENPFFGYGAIHRERLRKTGVFWITSHNTYIEMTFFYGILYLLIFVGLIVLLMSWKWEFWIGGVSGLNYMQMLGLGFLLYCLFANTLMQNRSFFFSLGFLLGIASKNMTNARAN